MKLKTDLAKVFCCFPVLKTGFWSFRVGIAFFIKIIIKSFILIFCLRLTFNSALTILYYWSKNRKKYYLQMTGDNNTMEGTTNQKSKD